MANAGTYNHTKQHFAEGAAAATPDASEVVVYAKADGLMYSKDDAGTETLMSSGASGGSVATDAIWDTAGDLAVGSGANTAAKLAKGTDGQLLSMVSGSVAWADAAASGDATDDAATAAVATDQATTSTSYTDLATAGPAVTVTVNTKALVIVSARIYGSAGDYAFMSFAASGANTIAAADTAALSDGEAAFDSSKSRSVLLTGLTPGSTTFTAKYRSFDGGNVHFLNRDISVIPMD